MGRKNKRGESFYFEASDEEDGVLEEETNEADEEEPVSDPSELQEKTSPAPLSSAPPPSSGETHEMTPPSSAGTKSTRAFMPRYDLVRAATEKEREEAARLKRLKKREKEKARKERQQKERQTMVDQLRAELLAPPKPPSGSGAEGEGPAGRDPVESRSSSPDLRLQLGSSAGSSLHSTPLNSAGSLRLKPIAALPQASPALHLAAERPSPSSRLAVHSAPLRSLPVARTPPSSVGPAVALNLTRGGGRVPDLTPAASVPPPLHHLALSGPAASQAASMREKAAELLALNDMINNLTLQLHASQAKAQVAAASPLPYAQLSPGFRGPPSALPPSPLAHGLSPAALTGAAQAVALQQQQQQQMAAAAANNAALASLGLGGGGSSRGLDPYTLGALAQLSQQKQQAALWAQAQTAALQQQQTAAAMSQQLAGLAQLSSAVPPSSLPPGPDLSDPAVLQMVLDSLTSNRGL